MGWLFNKVADMPTPEDRYYADQSVQDNRNAGYERATAASCTTEALDEQLAEAQRQRRAEARVSRWGRKA